MKPCASLDSLKPVTPLHVRWLEEIEKTAAEVNAPLETGVAVFWSDYIKLLVQPPFPVSQESLKPRFDTGLLRQILTKEYTLGVVLLRLGRYSVGVFKGDRLLASKTDTRYVKNRHRAGGSSQRRFERIREKQIYNIFVEACSVVAEKFGPFEKEMDYIFLGGERLTLKAFLGRCDYLRNLDSRTMKRVLSIGEPRHRELERALEEVWKSRVMVF